MVTFIIDDLTPCLVETSTGEIFETEVIRLKRKSFLSKFNKRTGWYINWSKFDNNVEVYALVLKGTVDIQGLIGVEKDDISKAIHIKWACTAPWNNKFEQENQKYAGVGGHLFALAADLSFKYGYEGYIYGEAINADVYEHYVDKYQAIYLGSENGLRRFMIPGERSQKIMEVYTYDWTEEEL